MTTPVELYNKREAAAAIIGVVKDEIELDVSVKEYVKGLSEGELDQVIESAAKALNNNMPELSYRKGYDGYDVYNADLDMRRIGVIVRSEDGGGAIIQISKDYTKKGTWPASFDQVFPFDSHTEHEKILERTNAFWSSFSKYEAMGYEGTLQERALKPKATLSKTGAQVHTLIDTRFNAYIADNRLTAGVLESWFTALDMSSNEVNDLYRVALLEKLGSIDKEPELVDLPESEPEPERYETWGSW